MDLAEGGDELDRLKHKGLWESRLSPLGKVWRKRWSLIDWGK